MNTTDTQSAASVPATYEGLYARQVELLARLAEVQRAVLDVATGLESREVTDYKEEAERAELDLLGDAQAQRDHAELVEVRAAIARLHDGNYGMCEACGEAIDRHRLEARPSAIRCTACQQIYETQAARSLVTGGDHA